MREREDHVLRLGHHPVWAVRHILYLHHTGEAVWVWW